MATALRKVELNDPATRHLHQDFGRIFVGHTVSEAMDSLRRHPPQGRILYLYVVDDEGRLVGVESDVSGGGHLPLQLPPARVGHDRRSDATAGQGQGFRASPAVRPGAVPEAGRR